MKKFWWENKKDGILIKEIYNSYLIWNMPFWANLSEKADMLDVKNVDFPMLKYRLHSGNYINNEIGKLNVINGELRTVTRLMEFYNIPMYKTQFYIYRIFNKLKLASNFSPLYFILVFFEINTPSLRPSKTATILKVE